MIGWYIDVSEKGMILGKFGFDWFFESFIVAKDRLKLVLCVSGVEVHDNIIKGMQKHV